ncbi:MAG: AI-2E family transporter [Tildeniella torsiva UHER 1998/13D]|nr:AI-2E family transporter [Tildeniella torsiva UHER 1998/13D]
MVFPRWLRNSLLFPLFFLNGWLFTLLINFLQPLVTMVLIAILLALVLDYPVQFLQGRGLARPVSLTLVVVVAIATIFIGGFLVLPLLVSQIGTFLNQLPQWVSSSEGLFGWLDQLPIADTLDVSFRDLQSQLILQMTGVMRTLGTTLLGLLAGGVSGGFKVFFVMVLTVFMLTKGGKVWAGIMSWLSPWWRDRLETRVPYKFKRFISVQVTLATGFGLVLAVIFTLIRVPLALMFAMLIGMGSLFPFMGAFAQTSVSLFVMFHDLGTGIQVFIIALVLGQILDEIILPKVMGDLIGVNPIWLIISVFIGARLGGVMGILIAVPIASVIKELVIDMVAEARGEATSPPVFPPLAGPTTEGPIPDSA